MAATVRVPIKFLGATVPGLYSTVSISSPAFADMIHFGMMPAGQLPAYGALENPAFNRGVQILSGTIASLPLKTYHWDVDEDAKEPSTSFLDVWPAGPGRMSPFNWKEQIVIHLVTAGECGLVHVHAKGGLDGPNGALIGLTPWPPTAYISRWEDGQKIFKVNNYNGIQQDFGDGCENAIDGRCMTQILGPSLDGLRGLSPMYLFRGGLALAQALDAAARRTMTSGMHASGLVSGRLGSKMQAEDAQSVLKNIKETMLGPEHAGELIVTNGEFEFTPWTQSNNEAQFIEQREFTVHEVSRMLGVPSHLLFSSSKDQSFASGLAEEWGAFARVTLMPITSRIEEAISPVVGPGTKFVEFDYKGLLQGTPESEVKLILEQNSAGLMSDEEARELLGLGPKDPLDTFRTPAAVSATGRPAVEDVAPTPPAAANGNGKMTNMPSMKARTS